MKCPKVLDKIEHPTHWYSVFAGNITVAGGQCPGYFHTDTPTTSRSTFMDEELEAILDLEWGYSTSNGMVTAKFCPVCLATVPYGGVEFDGEPSDPARSVKAHKQWHRDLAAAIKGGAS